MQSENGLPDAIKKVKKNPVRILITIKIIILKVCLCTPTTNTL